MTFDINNLTHISINNIVITYKHTGTTTLFIILYFK